ncbi:TMEM175 family protein [Sphingomonas sp. ASY06-1R]|uniref:TMEM175 family protein n=1 Tax=Sphingomonas sp. ASY06-1R TaxID=3445771 RepID=UPI003FA1BCB4
MSSPLTRSRESGYHRVEAYSDAVFAIISTLIAYDLMKTGAHAGSDLTTDLLKAWPFYLAFGMSFLVVGQMWLVHHNLWQMIRTADQGLLVLNLLLLFFIAVLPWAAKLVALHWNDHTSNLQIATAIYAAIALGQALTFNATLLWARVRNLYDESMTDLRYRSVRRRFLVGPVIYGAALIASFTAPYFSIAGYFAAALVYIDMGFLAPFERAKPKL